MARQLDQFDDKSADVQGTDFANGYRPGAKGVRWTLASLSTWIQSQLTAAFAPASHTHTSTALTDSTATGRAVIQAADGPAARGAIGAAGTSHTHPPAEITQSGATTGQAIVWNGSVWAPGSPAGTGTVTSVQVSTSLSGLSFSGGPITSSGTITLSGTLGLANGGTGGTDASSARSGLGLGGVAILEIGSTAGTVAAGDDARFLSSGQKTDLTDGNDSSAHYHPTDRARANHTGTQTLSTISDAGTAASRNAPSTGDAGSSEVVLGNDSRLTNARTPTTHTHAIADTTGLQTAIDGKASTTHASAHQSGGGDAIKLDDLAAPDDNTDLNASTTKHGLCPKFPGGTTDFLRADGSFAAPAGSGGIGYAIPWFTGAGDSPGDSATLYWSGWALSPSTNYDAMKVQIPKTGTLKAVYYRARCTGTTGSGESVNHYIRLNGSTDLANASFAYNAADTFGAATGLSDAVTAGDYIAVKIVCPAWATNPTSMRWAVTLYIE